MSVARRFVAVAALVLLPAAWGLTASAAHAQENCTGLIFVICTSPSAQPRPTVIAPTPLPFALPPITEQPSLAPVATPTPLTPVPTLTPSPSPSDAAVPAPSATPSPSPTPISLGADSNYTLPVISPSATGNGLDGGSVLIRVFLVLAVLAVGSVASMFALR